MCWLLLQLCALDADIKIQRDFRLLVQPCGSSQLHLHPEQIIRLERSEKQDSKI